MQGTDPAEAPSPPPAGRPPASAPDPVSGVRELRWPWIALGAWILLSAWCLRTLVGVSELSRFVDRGVRWMRDVEIYRRDVEGFQAAVMRTRGVSLAEPDALARVQELLGGRTGRMISTCPIPRGEADEPLLAWEETAARLAEAVRSLDLARAGAPDGQAPADAVLALAVARADMAVAVSRAVSELRARVTAGVDSLGVGWWTTYALGAVLLLSTGLLVILLARSRTQELSLRAQARSLREAEERLSMVVDRMPAVLWAIDRDLRFTVSLGGGLRHLGLRPNQVVGTTLQAFLGTDDPRNPTLAAHLAALAGEARPFETVFGGRTYRSEVRPLAGPDGELLGAIGVALDVTDDLRRDRRIRFQASLLGQVQGGVAAVDDGGRITYANAYAASLLGWTPEDVVGRPLEEVVASADPDASVAAILARAATEGRAEQEVALRRRSGGSIWAHVSAAGLAGEGGGAGGAVLVFLDVTARRESEEAHRRAEAKFRSIFENAVEGIFQSTPDGTLLAVNPALARILGYESPEEMHGRLGDIAREHHAEPGKRQEWENLLAEHGVVRNFEYRATRRDGGTLWLSENVRAVKGADGTVLYYEGTVEDVTERRLAADEIQRLQRFYEEILTKLPASVAVLDTEGRFLYLNPASVRDPDLRRRTLGRTDAEYVAGAGLPSGIAEARTEALRRCVESRETVVLEETVPATGGFRHYVRLHHAVVEEDGTVRMVIRFGLDITERRHLEESLRQSAKMEAVGRLAGGVAHDFNNILTVITGYCDLMTERVGEGDPLRPLALEVRDAADRAAAVTGQLLAFSRRQVLAPKEVVLGDAVREMEPMIRRLIGEDIDLAFEDGGARGLVRVDRGSLTQVLMNLAVNARDAMPRGGRLRVRTGALDVPSTLPGATGEGTPPTEPPPGPWETLVVEDNGEGVAPEHLPHLFEPFFTTKAGGKGAGLGLATVYGVVQQSGGHVFVDSEPGRGTRFCILLPRVGTPVPAPAEPAVAPAPPPRAGSERILVVEDETPIRNLVCTCLRKAGYEVLSAADGEAALRVAESPEGAGIDLLLTDVVMPRMGGGPLSRELRARRPDLRVLFMSGYTDDTLVLHGVSQEAQAFLQKPFRPSDLLARVRAVLDRQRS